jgi:hypothetical protein
MRQQRREIYPPALDYLHQASHPLIAAGAERRRDPVVTEPCSESIVWDLELA